LAVEMTTISASASRETIALMLRIAVTVCALRKRGSSSE
jgi:hypothetical protein